MDKQILFISDKHRLFYEENIERVREKDCYHMALIYTLGMNADCRDHFTEIYDLKSGMVNPDCLFSGWQTSGSMKVIRMAFNLYCNSMPSIDSFTGEENKLREASLYSVEELFYCSYAPFFWQAVQIRYPEYREYNFEFHKSLGQRD